jgi:hypothetical protein
MPTVLQCVCCKEISKVTDVIEELNDGQLTCITSHPGFDPVCLNTYVLQTAYCQYRQQYGVEVWPNKIYVCLGFPYRPFFYAYHTAFIDIF